MAGAHYARPAVVLHWLVAAGSISALCLGWFMTGLAISPTKVRLYNWHKWLGITWVLTAAVTLHFAAALKHDLVDRDDTLR